MTRRLAALVVVGGLGAFLLSAMAPSATAAQLPVDLRTAGSFAVLAGSTVTNTGATVVSGNLGVSPGTAVTGFPPGHVNSGTIHAADAVAAQAQTDATTAYNDAAGRSPAASVSADLGGQTLTPGVYSGPTLSLTGTLTLDGKGDPSAVFIFKAGSTLITAGASRVAFVGMAGPCNLVWQVGKSATLGTNSVFAGTVIALTSVTAQTGMTMTGRLLARNGAVTLDANRVTRPTCAAAASPTPSATGSPTPTATGSPSAGPTASGTPTPTTGATPTTSPLPGPSPGGTGGSPSMGPSPTSSSQPESSAEERAEGLGATDTAGPTGALARTGWELFPYLALGLGALACGTLALLWARPPGRHAQ